MLRSHSENWLFLSFGFVLALLAGCSTSPPEADPDTQRSLATGEIVGASIADGAVHAWRGVPFAQPPVDDLRWRAPQPPEEWDGVREVLASGSPCAQLGGDPIVGNEDCLYLDVFAPAMASGEVPTGSDRLPVMFWIHGGGNSMGAGDQIPAHALARDNGVILVTINYRLGVFGWFAHPAILADAEGADDASGNFGTLDMIAALEWVQENIAEFGGDPNRVTIFGESAGGVNVYSLLISPKAKGLFHAAISQSGKPVSMTFAQAQGYTDDPENPGLPGSAAELVLAILQRGGRAEDRNSAKELVAEMPEAEVASLLREASPKILLGPYADIMDAGMPMYIAPAVLRDGVVIPDEEPLALLSRKGGYNEVPFIAGTNREESKLFMLFDSTFVETTFGMPTRIVNERLFDVHGEYGGMMWRATGADEPVAAMRKAQGATVWSYRFDWDEEATVLGMDLSKLLGAAHALDLLFVFDQTDFGFGTDFFYEDAPSAAVLSKQMRSYWAEFAHNFKPGQGQEGELPEWTPWTEGRGKPKYMAFDSERDGGLTLETDAIDRSYVLNRAARDPRLLDDEERCAVFVSFVQWSDALSVEDYDRVGEGACAPWPIQSRFAFPSLSHQTQPY